MFAIASRLAPEKKSGQASEDTTSMLFWRSGQEVPGRAISCLKGLPGMTSCGLMGDFSALRSLGHHSFQKRSGILLITTSCTSAPGKNRDRQRRITPMLFYRLLVVGSAKLPHCLIASLSNSSRQPNYHINTLAYYHIVWPSKIPLVVLVFG